MPGHEARQADALDQVWDGVAAGAAGPEMGIDLPNPELRSTIWRLHALDGAAAPDPTFLRSLREELMHAHPAAGFGDAFGLAPGTTANGRSPAGWAAPQSVPPPPVPQFRWFTPWTRAIETIAAALLVLALAGGTIVSYGGLPALVGLWQDDRPASAAVPMRGANPGRTGEHPGPGPEAEPGRRWLAFTGTGVTAPAVVDGVVYLAGHTGSLAAFDTVTGAELWRTRLAGSASSPTVVDGTIYVGSVTNSETKDSAGYVQAFDAATGDERWQAPTGSFGGASPVVVDGIVYAGGDAELYAFEAATGRPRWRFAIDAPRCSCTSRDAAVAGGLVYATGGGELNRVLHAVDAATGQERWRFRADRSPLTSPVVAGDLVYVGSGPASGGPPSAEGNDSLYALDANDGDERWAADLDVASPPAVADGTVYIPVAAADGAPATLRALDAETGDERWATESLDVFLPPVVAGGTVYVAGGESEDLLRSDDGNLAAVDATTGRERWRIEFDGSVWVEPAVVDGTIYIAVYHAGVLLALGDVAFTSGTPDLIPAVAGNTIDREPCEAAPRPVAAGTPTAGTPTASVVPEGTMSEALTEEDLPTGQPATPDVVAGIEETVDGLRSCSDAEPERRAGFYSDDFFRRILATVEGEYTIEDAAILDGWLVSPSARVTVRDARTLRDGRAGAVVEGGLNRVFLVFVRDGEQWLIDEVALLPIVPFSPGTPIP